MTSETFEVGQKVEYVGAKMAHKVGATATVRTVKDGRVQVIWKNTGVGDWVAVADVKAA